MVTLSSRHRVISIISTNKFHTYVYLSNASGGEAGKFWFVSGVRDEAGSK